MLVSKFDSLFHTTPKSYETTWQDFVRALSKHSQSNNKNDVALISPAEWPKGSTRKKNLVKRIHFAALDLDKLPIKSLECVQNILKPYAHLIHTTWSHAGSIQKSGLSCLRVYIPLTRPVEIAEWPRFWKGLDQLFDSILDASCKDPGRVYFMPACPKGAANHNYARSHEGKTLDVEKIINNQSRRHALAAKEEAENDKLKNDLIFFSLTLIRRKSLHHQALGHVLKKVLQGKAFAVEGERDTKLFKLCALLAEKFPKTNPKSIAQHFVQSLRVMQAQAEGAPTFDDVVSKIERKQKELAEESHEKDVGQEDDLAARIRAAFGGKRDTPYTQEELAKFAKAAGVSIKDFQRRWIIQCNSSFYVFLNGTYSRPLTKDSLESAVYCDLAPAHTVGVNLYRETANGVLTLKSLKELMRDYGSIATRIVASLEDSKSYFDWTTKTFHEAACPLRRLEPEFNQEIDDYLRVLGGNDQERLLDWIAVVTKLSEPCAALFLHGPNGCGKSILAEGLARLWTTEEPTSMDLVIRGYNDSLMRCPLVFADEKLPTIFKKEGSTADLRVFIQHRNRTLERRYRDDATLRGSIRLIIAANNQLVMNTSEQLTVDDIRAIQERIFYIRVSEASKKFLESIPFETRHSWVKLDELAKHALWLRDHRDVKRGNRFLVGGNKSAFHQYLATETGMRSPALHWLVEYLQDPRKIGPDAQDLIRIHQNKLLVNAKVMTSNWDIYPTNVDKKNLTLFNISNALSGLSERKTVQRNSIGKPTKYWVIRTEYLLSWCEESGHTTKNEIRALLGLPINENEDVCEEAA